VLVVRRDGVADDIRVEFYHVRFIGADAGDVAAFLASLGIGKVACWEEGGAGGCSAEDHVRGSHVFFQETFVLGVHWREEVGFHLAVVATAYGVHVARVVRLGVVEPKDAGAGGFEIPRDDVEVVDLAWAEQHGQTDVPVGLLAGAEDGEVVDGGAFFEEHGGG